MQMACRLRLCGVPVLRERLSSPTVLGVINIFMAEAPEAGVESKIMTPSRHLSVLLPGRS